MLSRRPRRAALAASALLVLSTASRAGAQAPAQTPASGQTVVVMERVTFSQAVERALQNNLTVAQVATGVLRAEGLLQQARSAVLPTVNANLNVAILNAQREIDGNVTQPRTQGTFTASA